MPAKSTLRDKNKKLTDFFLQRPSASVPPLATFSIPAPTSTISTTRKRSAIRASTTAADYSVSSSGPLQTRKRARSPDSNDPSMFPTHPTKLKSQRKPLKVPKSNPYSKQPAPIAYVSSPLSSYHSPAQQPTPMQVHTNTLVASPSDSSKQVVCSSQSDEAELALPAPEPRDFGKVVEGIHTWRQKTSEFSPSPSPRARGDAMEVDTPPSSPIRGSPVASVWSASSLFDAPVRSAATPGNSAAPQASIGAPAGFPSLPDANELPPLPPTPEPVDPETKTAKLIAEIKARAFATSRSSDDEERLEFRELEDSDDGDLIDDLPLISYVKEPSAISDIFSSPLSSVPSTFGDVTIGRRTRRTPDRRTPPLRPTRTSTRACKPAPAFRLPTTILESQNSVSETKSRSSPSNRKKPQVVNPLHALLREKELQDKRGTSYAAMRLAEEAVKEGSCEVTISSDDEFDLGNKSHIADEQAAWKAVREYRISSSPAGHDGAEDFTFGDRESKMLGAVAGEAISKILASDKGNKGKERASDTEQETTWGIPLWIQSEDEDMDVDSAPIPPLSGHPILVRLDGLRKRGDNSLLDLVLRAGVLVGVPRDILFSNIPQLLDIALFGSSQIADAVSVAFRHLWEVNPSKSRLPFAAILLALVRLGASPSILAELGLSLECAKKSHVTPETLLEALKRLLAIVKAAGFTGAFSPDDVGNVVLTLVIMGLDPLTSSELHTQLNITTDVVCNHSIADCQLRDIIHEKVLGFAKQLAPVNKARMISFFASGSGRTGYIARRLAYCLLVSAPSIPEDQAPPLEPLILLLSPDAGSGEVCDVTNASTDYEKLLHHINILSVALADITPYVEEERAVANSASILPTQGSPNKPKKSLPPLELLHRVLEALQSRIVDTRAAHLDRSRTKAAIQRLTMRICYDRAALGGRPRRRASTLKAYFSPQRQ